MKAQRMLWFPMKVQPWKSLSLLGCHDPCKPVTCDVDGCFGFIPVYESREQAQKEFPDDTIMTVSTVEQPKQRKRATRRGGRK